MFFLRNQRDSFDRVYQALHPFDPRSGVDCRLDLNVTYRRQFGPRTVLFNEHNLAWAAFEPEEVPLLDTLPGRTMSSVLAAADGADREALQTALYALYARGLLKFDGVPYVHNGIFEHGPHYHHTYLIELLLTERCNLRCNYCFAEVGPKKKLMAEDTAEAILSRVLELPTSRLFVEFSGGEVFLNFPTFRFCVDYLRRHGTSKDITLTAQTNATLLNEEIIAFCADNAVHLSLTLDGPPEIHDKQRVNWSGKGSHDAVVSAIQRLQAADLPFGLIGVVTANSLGHEATIMNHYRDLGVQLVKLNHLTPQGYSREAWDEIGIDGAQYLSFIRGIYTWMRDNDAAVVDSNVETFVLNLLSRTSPYRCTRTACRAGSEFLVFDPDGEIFPCPRFKHNPRTRLGNVHQALVPVDQLYRDNALISGIDERNVNQIPACSRCEWRNACRGGCSLETYEAFHSLDRESGICSFYKGIYPFLFEKLVAEPEFVGGKLVSGLAMVEARLPRVDADAVRGAMQ